MEANFSTNAMRNWVFWMTLDDVFYDAALKYSASIADQDAFCNMGYI